MRPIQFDVYKGMTNKWGSAQFRFSTPHFRCKQKCKNGYSDEFPGRANQGPCGHSGEDYETQEGTIFLEVASTTGPNIYDWDHKVVMALAVNDMGKILHFLRYGNDPEKGGLKLMHDPGAKSDRAGQKTKSLTLDSPNGIRAGFMLTISQKEGEVVTTHKVPFDGAETVTLSALFQATIPEALAWKSTG